MYASAVICGQHPCSATGGARLTDAHNLHLTLRQTRIAPHFNGFY